MQTLHFCHAPNRSAQGESFSDEDKQASTAPFLFTKKWSPEAVGAQGIMENKLV